MRTILFVLALLGATAGRGQIVLDWYSSAAPAAGLLLDDYPNAAAAYSLRLLNSAYTGNCIEVRRANDNALQNIGFAGGVLDTAALKTFCGANDCFVRTWYDQSLNGRNIIQSATTTRQPSIVINGAVVRGINNLPSVFFDGSDLMLSASFAAQSAPVTKFTVNRYNSIASFPYVAGFNADNMLMGYPSGAGNRNQIYNGVYLNYTPIVLAINVNYLWYALFNTTNSEININNAGLITGNTGTRSGTFIVIGAQSSAIANSFFTGHMSEHIVYFSNQSSNQTGIRSNINSFYNIY